MEAGNSSQNIKKTLALLNILDRYIIKKFLVTLFFIVTLFSLIACVFDASEKIDKFVSNQIPFIDILQFYAFNFLPFLINLISPIFIFIAALFFTSRMAYNSEIVASFGAGISFWRLLMPYLVVASLLTMGDLVLKNFIVPTSNKGYIEFENKYIRKGTFNPNLNIHRQLQPGEFFSLERYHYADSMGTRFALEHFDGLELKDKVISTYLRWDHVKRKWYAHKYRKRVYTDEGQTLDVGDTLYLDLDMLPGSFTRQQTSITAMITPELMEFIDKEIASGNPDVKFFKVELYQRFSIPFASFILIMIAYALASRKVRGGTGMHLMLGLLIAVTFILFMRFTITFGQQTSLHPLAAVWIPNVFFIVIVSWLLTKAPK